MRDRVHAPDEHRRPGREQPEPREGGDDERHRQRQRQPVGPREVEPEQQGRPDQVRRRAKRGRRRTRRPAPRPAPSRAGPGVDDLRLERPHHLRDPDPLREPRDAHLLEVGCQEADDDEAEVVAGVAREVGVGGRAHEPRQKQQRADRQHEAERGGTRRRSGSRRARPARAGRTRTARGRTRGGWSAGTRPSKPQLRFDAIGRRLAAQPAPLEEQHPIGERARLRRIVAADDRRAARARG